MIYVVQVGGKYFDLSTHDEGNNAFLYCEKEYGIKVEDFNYEELEEKLDGIGVYYEEFID